jgi:hypothetical protein
MTQCMFEENYRIFGVKLNWKDDYVSKEVK